MLDFISNIAANRDSGRLNVVTDTTDGALLFKEGKLVDARLGSLTGFQAINALASMSNARFSFDPSVVPHGFSFITPSERVVLKQFFGIDTFEPQADDEATLVATRHTSHAEVPGEVPAAVTYAPKPRFSYSRALVMAAVVIVIAAAVAVLIFMSRETSTQPTQATAVEPMSPPASAATASAPVSTATAPAATARATPAPAAQDLTGKWTVVNTVDTTSYQQFKNMKIGFDVSIDQTGRTFTGRGQKISENGRSLPANSRTPIQLQGTIDGDRVEATFFEEGTTRKSNGRFVWRINKSGLNGIFATTAARSSGKSAARREL